MQRKSSFQGPCILPEPLWRLCPYRPEQGSRPPWLLRRMEQPPGWTASPENRLKNWLFCRAACGNFPRMAAKLRPVGRQTTPPEHAGELPAYSLAEQRNFFTGFQEKQSSQEAVPSAAEARGTGTLLRSIWTEAPERLRKNAGPEGLFFCISAPRMSRTYALPGTQY